MLQVIDMKIATKIAPVEDKLKLLNEIGFENLEIYTNEEHINKRFVKILNSFDFNYAVQAPTQNYDESIIDFADAINARVIVVHNILEISRLGKIVSDANALGIDVCTEFGLSRVHKITSIEEFFELKKKIKSIKMCLDVEHAVIANVFPEIIRAVGRDIHHVHISGSPPGEHRPPQDNPDLVVNAINELKKVSYDKFLVAEMDMEYQKKDVLIETKQFLEKTING